MALSGFSNQSYEGVFDKLVIATNIGPWPTAMLAMTVASTIPSTVAHATGSVTESSKAETVGRLLRRNLSQVRSAV
jgi:hypothetical protein